MKGLAVVFAVAVAFGSAGCGNEQGSLEEKPVTADPVEDPPAPGDVPQPETEDEQAPQDPPVSEQASGCVVTHFSPSDESDFRVEAAYEGSDCIKCPGPTDVIRLTYTGTGFLQELTFDGADTNSPAALTDERILQQSGNVCWADDYDPITDLPDDSAFTVDGHAATIEFEFGPDVAGPDGVLSYYRNGVLQFAIPVTEGSVPPMDDLDIPLG